MNTPRGLRNNNPLNLRKSHNSWLGKVENSSDPSFEQFISLTYGIRAGFINIRTQVRRNPGLTVKGLIEIWAPPSDGNATSSYIRQVCARIGFPPCTIVSFHDKAFMVSLVSAMIRVECGQPVDDSIIGSAYDLI